MLLRYLLIPNPAHLRVHPNLPTTESPGFPNPELPNLVESVVQIKATLSVFQGKGDSEVVCHGMPLHGDPGLCWWPPIQILSKADPTQLPRSLETELARAIQVKETLEQGMIFLCSFKAVVTLSCLI